VEWSILAGCAACFCLLYVLFSKFFPIVAIWEVREGREKKREQIIEYVRERLPEKGEELEEVLPE